MNTSTLRKFSVLSLALLTAFAVNARAQAPFPNASHNHGTKTRNHVLAPPPGALWYNGDFDFVDGLTNEQDTFASGYAHIYDNFDVTDGGGWDLTSVFSHDLISTTVIGASWEIRSGVSGGNGGTLVASGSTSSPSVVPTGNNAFGFDEFEVSVPVDVHLDPGTYWLNVTPIGNLDGNRSFNSTTDGTNCVGTPCGNDDTAFLDSDLFGANFEPVADFGAQFHDFSMGVIGNVGGGPLVLQSVASRKTHGGAGKFDVTLPGVDPRKGPATFVFTFSNTLASVDSSSTSCGSITATKLSGRTYSVMLDSSACNQQNVTVTLSGIHDTLGQTLTSAEGTAGLLLGDVDGDGTVTAADEASINMHLREPVTSSNFRNDVLNNGQINAMDRRTTKSHKGDGL